MKKYWICFWSLILFCMLSYAEELWMKPTKFLYKVGENLVVNFRLGDNFFGLAWNFETPQIVGVELHQKNVKKDLKSKVTKDPKINLSTPLELEGTYVLTLQTSEELVETQAKAFNEYLDDYALDDANYSRKKNNETDKNGTEIVTRYSKLIVQSGEKLDNTFRKEIGFPVEILPEENPYSLKVGSPVHFKILYNKKPLFGVRVKVWNLYNNKVSVQNIFAQQDGVIETHITNNGSWMVSFAKMIPSKESRADWQTLRASLVFGIK
jgi:uncharacterized GH25 family protein